MTGSSRNFLRLRSRRSRDATADAEDAAVLGGAQVPVGEDLDAALEAGALEPVPEAQLAEGVGVGGLRGEGRRGWERLEGEVVGGG